MIAGFSAAWQRGYSHALQIDADGQHALGDISTFIEEARRHPQALICGRPVFDRSMPAVRPYGRYLTHGLVWLNTLSFSIPDSMCGFRVYPLAPVIAPDGRGVHWPAHGLRRGDHRAHVLARRADAVAADPGHLPRWMGSRIFACSATTPGWSRCSCGCSAACCAGCRGCWAGRPMNRLQTLPQRAGRVGRHARTRRAGHDVADVPRREAAVRDRSRCHSCTCRRRISSPSADVPGPPRGTTWRGSPRRRRVRRGRRTDERLPAFPQFRARHRR